MSADKDRGIRRQKQKRAKVAKKQAQQAREQRVPVGEKIAPAEGSTTGAAEA